MQLGTLYNVIYRPVLANEVLRTCVVKFCSQDPWLLLDAIVTSPSVNISFIGTCEYEQTRDEGLSVHDYPVDRHHCTINLLHYRRFPNTQTQRVSLPSIEVNLVFG